MSSNVQLWFAKNQNQKIVTINEVDKANGDKYYCPLCQTEVLPRQGSINSWCFAHLDSNKCNAESMVHFWVKHKLIEKGDIFIVESDKRRKYKCKDVLVEQSYDIEGKIYRPDLTVITDSGETIYFEMKYTNKKKLEDYIDLWIGLKNIVVEVDIRTLINSQNKKLPDFKALWYKDKCFNIVKGDDSAYYETIGKYKEKLIKSNKYNDKKDEIQQLDWFWREVQNFKQDKTSLNEILTFIDNVENKKLVYNILKRAKCNNLKDSYEQYKINMYTKNTKDLLKCDYEKYEVRLLVGKNGVSKRIRLEIEDKHNLKYECFNNLLWHGFKYDSKDVDVLLDYIDNKKKALELDDLRKAKWNEIKTVVEVIEKLEHNFDFTLSYEYNNDEFKVNIFMENEVFLREKIGEISYKDIIANKLGWSYTERNYNIMDDKVEAFLRSRIVKLVIETMRQTTIGISKWKCEKEEYDILKENILKELYSSKHIHNIIPNFKDGNAIYFEDSNGNKNILHHPYSNYFYYNNNIDLNIDCNETVNHINLNNMDLSRLNDEGFYFLFNGKHYTISYKNPYHTHVYFEYKTNILKNKEINITFNKKLKDYKRLDRFNFVECNIKLKNLIKNEIKQFVRSKEIEFEDELNTKVFVNEYNYKKLNTKELDDTIKKYLYPICYISNNSDTINIILNCDFTKDNEGRYRPWLIDDFIEILMRLGIDNVINTKYS